MQNIRSTPLPRVLTLLAGLLIVKVTVAAVLKYRDYLPPNFQSDFLHGREAYFWDAYHWAFYLHIATGPFALIFGLILISEKFRRRFPKWHRYLGRIQVFCVLCLVAPSGLWMAYHAEAGPIAAFGFASLAIATGTCVALGWRSAVQRRFADHRRWMMRSFLLLCSAVVIRVIGGLATVMEVQALWIDTLMAWASWLTPLVTFEVSSAARRLIRRAAAQPVPTTPGR